MPVPFRSALIEQQSRRASLSTSDKRRCEERPASPLLIKVSTRPRRGAGRESDQSAEVSPQPLLPSWHHSGRCSSGLRLAGRPGAAGVGVMGRRRYTSGRGAAGGQLSRAGTGAAPHTELRPPLGRSAVHPTSESRRAHGSSRGRCMG